MIRIISSLNDFSAVYNNLYGTPAHSSEYYSTPGICRISKQTITVESQIILYLAQWNHILSTNGAHFDFNYVHDFASYVASVVI